jgi:hypothetical protein
MNLANRLKDGLSNLFSDLDRAAEKMVPWIDRGLAWGRSVARHAKTEAQSRDALYGELGRRTHELLWKGGDIGRDPRVLELLASITRREAEVRAHAGAPATPPVAAE